MYRFFSSSSIIFIFFIILLLGKRVINMLQITEDKVSSWLPVRDENTYKNKMGHVLCVGGNANMGGAIILSASAALYAGAGLVTVASAPENVHALHARIPEAMFTDMYELNTLSEYIQKADVIVLGPGLGLSDRSLTVFKQVLNTINKDQWLIIDGDAITHFVNEKETLQIQSKNIVFTPHLGEWQRMTNIKPPADHIKENQTQKNNLQATVILKKGRSEIYIEDEIWQNIAGNPSMATGGMGDILTGIIASFLGQFDNKKQAILSALYVHSATANKLAKTHYTTLPTTIINELPIFIKSLNKQEKNLLQ